MPPPKDDPILELLERQLAQGSTERQAQTASFERMTAAQTSSFERMILGLRWELRVIVIILVVLAAVRDGFMGLVKIPGLEIDTRPASIEAPAENIAKQEKP